MQVAQKSNPALDLFLITLSHELRTPITSILCWVQMLKANSTNPKKIHQGLLAIEEAALAQKQLINDLLDFSGVVLEKISINLTDVDLVSIIKKTIDTLRVHAEEKNIEIVFSHTLSSNILRLDGDRMRQIISNLLINALKFTPANGKITIQLNEVDDYVSIQIKDNGRGIEADFLPYIFDRFSQANPKEPNSGLGIGLALVKKLLELQGGTISADSQGLGCGATFTITLPRRFLASVT